MKKEITETKQITGKEIAAYQDGGYDALKQLLELLKDPLYETSHDCILQIEYIIKEMESVSARKLGLK